MRRHDIHTFSTETNTYQIVSAPYLYRVFVPRDEGIRHDVLKINQNTEKGTANESPKQQNCKCCRLGFNILVFSGNDMTLRSCHMPYSFEISF